MRSRDKIVKWKHGDPIPGVTCPKCGGPVTYNGNYFCTQWVYPFTGEPGTCDWALPDEDATPKEKHLFNVAYVNLMRARGEEPKVDALLRKRNGEPW